MSTIRYLLSFLALVPTAAAFSAEWNKTATIDAPEAVQAAAADEDYAYAISSTQVAKYDRATGNRVGTSTGSAEHLNSGFLADGKLYCAHSNYPRTPERSEIKVFDTESLALETWKDFGNFGGSLTWAVRKDKHWWCNFARYGAKNAETFLVKFDGDWQELGRYTYPPELFQKLGNYSLSGGIWKSGQLLVTGHDAEEIYVLRLPKEGSVLEFVETQRIPFTGQGIAVDPKTGGLVGIQRGKKQLVFASSDPVLPAKEDFHLYLLIGQSNMAGRGKLDEAAKTAPPGVFKFTKDKTWSPATDPLHFDKPIAGVGLGTSFGKAMAEAKGKPAIGLIPCAVGGTPLSRWQKGGDLYQQAVVRTKAAQQDGVLKGILWHQGEGDSGSEATAKNYAERLSGMVADLRRELNAPDVPFVAGELGHFLKKETKDGKPSYWPLVNEQLHLLPDLIPKAAVVSSAELKPLADNVHFDTPSLREFGKRYAEALQKLQQK